MNRRTTALLVGIMIVLGVVCGVITSTIRPSSIHEIDRDPIEPPSELTYSAKIILSFVNLFLMLSLFIIYADIYRSVRSRFTIGLLATISALLVYAITSSPILQMFLGYPISGPGPFLFIPDIFTALAAGVLTYLSIE